MSIEGMIKSRVNLEIPGQISFWKTANIPHRIVSLPLVASAKLGWKGHLMLPFSLFLICNALALITVLFYSFSRDERIALYVILIFGIFSLGVLGALFFGNYLMMLYDIILYDEVLIVQQSGLIDFRISDKEIAWSNIEFGRLNFMRSGLGSVTIRLRQNVKSKFNIFRFGASWISLRKLPNEHHVAVANLTASDFELAMSILTLIKQNGGEIKTRSVHGEDPFSVY